MNKLAKSITAIPILLWSCGVNFESNLAQSEPAPIVEYFQTGNAMVYINAVVLIVFAVFIYRILYSNRIISRQNKDMSQQQEELEKAKLKLLEALDEEKKTRQTLESTHQNLKAAQSQLIHVEKMSSLGQLTAGIAHEINNPVSFIKGGMQTLKMAVQDLYSIIEQYQNTDTSSAEFKEEFDQIKPESATMLLEVKEMVEQLFKDILFGTDRVTEIVNGLRVFSRHDEAKVKAASVHENLDAAFLILKHKIKDRIEVIKQYDPNVREIDCLPGQLNQVFVNLVSNAIDAMDDFGTLIVSTHNLSDKVQLSFKDNGKGIPDEVRDKIFDPFFTTKDVGEGTGLGLSISHSIIKQHNGVIEVFSGRNAGTEFRITLPKLLELEKESDRQDSNEADPLIQNPSGGKLVA